MEEEGGWFFASTLTRVLSLDWPEGAGIDDVIWVCFPGAKGQEGTALCSMHRIMSVLECPYVGSVLYRQFPDGRRLTDCG